MLERIRGSFSVDAWRRRDDEARHRHERGGKGSKAAPTAMLLNGGVGTSVVGNHESHFPTSPRCK
eukprot:2555306-Pyramimonas_sp.AAC.1